MIMLLIGLGTFLNSDQPLLTFAALETTGTEVAATTLGFMSFSRIILAAVAPPIGSIFYNISPDQVFIYIAVLFAIAIGILIITPIPKPQKNSRSPVTRCSAGRCLAVVFTKRKALGQMLTRF